MKTLAVLTLGLFLAGNPVRLYAEKTTSFEHLDQAAGGIESAAGGGASLEGSSQQAFRSQQALMGQEAGPGTPAVPAGNYKDWSENSLRPAPSGTQRPEAPPPAPKNSERTQRAGAFAGVGLGLAAMAGLGVMNPAAFIPMVLAGGFAGFIGGLVPLAGWGKDKIMPTVMGAFLGGLAAFGRFSTYGLAGVAYAALAGGTAAFVMGSMKDRGGKKSLFDAIGNVVGQVVAGAVVGMSAPLWAGDTLGKFIAKKLAK